VEARSGHERPDPIFQSAKQFVGDPLLQMEQAHQLVQGRCKVSPIAFGVVGVALLSGPDEKARATPLKTSFQEMRETRLVPGIGAMSSPLASSQARAV
jgi:hypothetical protein